MAKESNPGWRDGYFSNEETARRVNDVMVGFGLELHATYQVVKSTESQEVSTAYRDLVSRLMMTMLIEAMNPIYAKYPELKPPRASLTKDVQTYRW